MTIRIYDGGGSSSDSNSRPAGICTSVEAKGDAALKPDRKREREKRNARVKCSFTGKD